jgi:vacuolar-type H+-ATPase subunit E/Vma4
MPSVREFLERLRPSGTPGAPSAAGVPVDRMAEVAAELEPVFAALDDAQAEAARIRAEGRQEASRRREQGLEEARSVLDEATRRSGAERADAAALVKARSESVVRDITAAAQRDADGIRATAEERLPDFGADIAEQAWARLHQLAGDAP